ncbi:unnamed protein product [Rhizoctonia solani]|uniref:Uncharacterized protein n=1 Tax=Rhizoctonia solani TaxID=456999 RepID=A0A8H3CWI4_9AGAM|nr:unnamed protein product [Rhizoctonia solani]
MPRTSSILSHTTASSSKNSLNDPVTQSSQLSFQAQELQHRPSSPLSSSQSSIHNSPTESEAPDSPHLPRATATKRDRLIGEAERAISKVVHDPELHERGELRAAGGKELADGLTVVD